jgi:hypothetical protein
LALHKLVTAACSWLSCRHVVQVATHSLVSMDRRSKSHSSSRTSVTTFPSETEAMLQLEGGGSSSSATARFFRFLHCCRGTVVSAQKAQALAYPEAPMVSPWALVPAGLPPPTKSSHAGNEAPSQTLLVFPHFIHSSWKWLTSAERLLGWKIAQVPGQGSPGRQSLTLSVFFPEGSEAHATYQKLPARGNEPRASAICH